ncbi:MAG: hypothetical protein BIFFINMI_01747 [Phycisphaerae bacterium]|nr:hypothetical protein [Phycisphaerae bacterium]
MTPRERYIATLTFGRPDRIPLSPGGPRESTLKRWRSEGLPAGVNWFGHLLQKIGVSPEAAGISGDPGDKPRHLDADFRMIPQFEEKVLEHRDGHYVVQDWKGNVCEISDQFDVSYLRNAIDFVTRRWIKCPVETRDDWEAMKTRYDLDAPGRWPADFDARCAALADRSHVVGVSFSGPFWQLREWCGFEGLCELMVTDPGFVDEMAAFWTDFIDAMLERILDRVVVDHVLANEDMAYKEHAMISPAMTRRFCGPGYARWFGRCRAAGVPVIDVDSDGFIGELIPIWIKNGVNCCCPMEVAAGNDINAFRARFGRSMAYTGGVDKRKMAAGGAELSAELARIAPVIRDGGFIPGCDHGVPSDVSWPNFVDYTRQLAELTGWL